MVTPKGIQHIKVSKDFHKFQSYSNLCPWFLFNPWKLMLVFILFKNKISPHQISALQRSTC
jgi:hypothetical protein